MAPTNTMKAKLYWMSSSDQEAEISTPTEEDLAPRHQSMARARLH
jgi:hypothetical protein